MTYTTDIKKSGLQWVWYVEIIPRTCGEVYGTSPCTASGGQCAYSWATCEDKNNFNLTTRTFKFSSKMGAHIFVGEQVQPTLQAVSDLPTEISPNKFTTINTRVQMVFEDVKNPSPFDSDKGTGKFYPYRTSTFWRIFKRIYRESLKYCKVKIYEGTSEYTTLSEFSLRHELLLNNIEFMTDGKVAITATDKTRQTKQIKIPNTISSTNVLSAGISDSDSSIPVTDYLEFKELAGTYSTKNYIKIIDDTNGDEYIKYGWISTGGTLEDAHRGFFGTSAVAHSSGCSIIQVAAFANDADTGLFADEGMNPVDILLMILIGWVGIPVADIDVTQFENERDTWFNSKRFRRIVESSTDADKLITQINQLLMANVWQNSDQKLTFKGFHPAPITSTVADLSTDSNIIEDTLDIDGKVETQISRVIVHYSPNDVWGTKSYTQQSDFSEHLILINAAAENENGQDDIVEIEFYANWIYREQDSRRFASRYSKRYSPTAPEEVYFLVTRKNTEIMTGDLVDLSTDRFVDDDGTELTENFQILSKTESQIGIIRIKALQTKFVLKYGFIAPVGYPVWSGATEAQKTYAYVCEVLSDGTPQMTDGSEATYIW